jgi:hypothetical protein
VPAAESFFFLFLIPRERGLELETSWLWYHKGFMHQPVKPKVWTDGKRLCIIFIFNTWHHPRPSWHTDRAPRAPAPAGTVPPSFPERQQRPPLSPDLDLFFCRDLVHIVWIFWSFIDFDSNIFGLHRSVGSWFKFFGPFYMNLGSLMNQSEELFSSTCIRSRSLCMNIWFFWYKIEELFAGN